MRETSSDDLRSKNLRIINKNMTQITKIWPPSLKMKGTIYRLHTKFQPNQLKNAEVMHVFQFSAGRLVGW